MSITLYHYTDTDGKNGIKRSKRINMSSRKGDMRYGRGVYLTSIHPSSASKADIAANNYDGRSNAPAYRRMEAGRVDSYVEIEFDLNNPYLEEVLSERDVYLYKKDIVLSNFVHDFGDV